MERSTEIYLINYFVSIFTELVLYYCYCCCYFYSCYCYCRSSFLIKTQNFRINRNNHRSSSSRVDLIRFLLLYSNIHKKKTQQQQQKKQTNKTKAFDFLKRSSYTNVCLKFLCDAKLITPLPIF